MLLRLKKTQGNQSKGEEGNKKKRILIRVLRSILYLISKKVQCFSINISFSSYSHTQHKRTFQGGIIWCIGLVIRETVVLGLYRKV